MLKVTEGALQYLAEMLDQQKAPEGTVVRCMAEDDTLGLVPGAQEPGDTVYKLEDRAVLVVASELAEALDEQEFDVTTTEEGTGITLV